MRDEPVLFHERQYFRQAWLWVLVIASLVPLLVIMGVLLPERGAAALPPFLLVLAVVAATLGLMWWMHLDVWVTEGELVVKLTPLHLKPRRIARTEIVEAKSRTYDALREYGGWGIRGGFGHGSAYNVSGDQGVQLVLANGKRLLIGSQRAGELEEALTAQTPYPPASSPSATSPRPLPPPSSPGGR